MPEALDFRDPDWVAEQLNIDKNSVYRYLNEGLLPGLQLGRKWLISESSLVEFLKAEEARQTHARQQLRLAEDLELNPRYDRFSQRARQVLTVAQEEARRRNVNYVGQEHLLLAIAIVPGGMGHALLTTFGIAAEQVRTGVERVVGRASFVEPVSPEFGVTPRLKRAIELAVEEAEQLDHSYVGVEHLVLGLLREGQGIGSAVLMSLGLTLDRTREAVLRLLMLPVAERNQLADRSLQTAAPPLPKLSEPSETIPA